MSEVVARPDGGPPLTAVVTVTTAGTRVQLTATRTLLSSGVQIRARGGAVGTANTGVIYVGGLTVAAANGYVLQPGESVFIETRDLSNVWIDSSVSGDSVTYLAT